MIRIGVDFDNTIICYDKVFHSVAIEKGLIPVDLPPSKGGVRDYLRDAGREDEWTELQGYVYGTRLSDAMLYKGVPEFFRFCKSNNISVFVISHKTKYPYMGPKYDLHRSAHDWMEDQFFFDSDRIGLAEGNVFFELTKQEKINRIIQLECTHFIDDLPEFLNDTAFPQKTKKILFDPHDKYHVNDEFQRASSWKAILHQFKAMVTKHKGLG
jgi:hypothetical protein